jgi:hypothetical protein
MKNMRRAEKIALINARNPEWRELVTENGFCEVPESWEDKVKRVISELKKGQ